MKTAKGKAKRLRAGEIQKQGQQLIEIQGKLGDILDGETSEVGKKSDAEKGCPWCEDRWADTESKRLPLHQNVPFTDGKWRGCL